MDPKILFIGAGVLGAAALYTLATSKKRTLVPGTGFRVFPILDTPTSNIRFTDDFGDPRSEGRSHAGNDLFATEGTPVVAPDDGTITFTDDGKEGGAGCPPPLSFHLQGTNGMSYFGTHLASLVGPVGTIRSVHAGETIGTVGHGGNACTTAPHLHFELKINGTIVDPYPYLISSFRLSG